MDIYFATSLDQYHPSDQSSVMGIHRCHERLAVSLSCTDNHQRGTVKASRRVCDVWVVLFARSLQSLGRDIVRSFFFGHYWARGYEPAQTFDQAIGRSNGIHIIRADNGFTFGATAAIF